MPYLDVIYAAGPFSDSDGNGHRPVAGVLADQSPDSNGLPDPVAFTKGVALALVGDRDRAERRDPGADRGRLPCSAVDNYAVTARRRCWSGSTAATRNV
jgi:hypothetical protein